jgi:hypothetical protein
MKPGALIATIVFALIAVAQMLRFLLQVEVTAGGVIIPLWPSLVASVLTAGIAILLWRENRPR